jgi:hypothetical protein
MNELGPQARALLALVEDGHDPPQGASERVWQATTRDIASLGAGGAHGAGSASAWQGAAGSFLGKAAWVLAVIAGAGVVAFLLVMAKPPTHTRALPSPVLAPPLAPPPASATELAPNTNPPVVSADQAKGAPAQLTRAPGATHGTGQHTPHDALLQEVTALRRASDLLTHDQPAQALALLRAQRNRFRAGALSEEREALMLLARCALGASASEKSSVMTFLDRTPNSVLRGRLESTCRLTEHLP